MTYLKRDIARALYYAVADMPVVVLTEMRQTGKSTFLRNQREFKDWKYVTFEAELHRGHPGIRRDRTGKSRGENIGCSHSDAFRLICISGL